MKLTLKRKTLKDSLSFLQKAIPSKPQLPILSSIYFNLEQSVLTLAATDLYLGVRTKNDVTSNKSLEMVIPGNTFKDIIYSFEPGSIVLEEQEKSLLVKSQKSEVKIPTQNAEEYPDFPSVNGETFELSASILEQIKELASFAASTDQARPVLTAIMLNFHPEGLDVVATDGFRLSILNFDQLKTKKECSLLVPVKAFNEVFRIVSQADASKAVLQVSEELKQVKFAVKQTEVFVRLIEGDYPPYEKIMPTTFKSELIIDGEELKRELSRAHILSKEASNIVKLRFEDEKMEIKSSSPAYGKYQGQVFIDNKNKTEDQIAFNANYLLDFLNSVKPEQVWFGMNESLKPAMIEVDGIDNFKYVVMPFRVNE